MSVTSTKRDRDKAQVLHESAVKKLITASSVGAPNERSVKLDLANVKTAFNNLVTAHTDYVAAQRHSLDSQASTEYMDARSNRHYEALAAADTALVGLGVQDQPDEPGVMSEAERKKTIRIKKGQLTVLEAETADLIELLTPVTEARMLHDAFGMANEQVKVVDENFKRIVELTAELDDLDIEGAEARDGRVTPYLTEKRKLYNKLKINLITNRPEPVAPAAHPPGGGAAAAGGAATAPAHEKLKGLKLEAVGVPNFDGTARGYATFRKFWDENLATLTPSAQYAHLLKALPKFVKDKLSCVKKESSEIWSQLEDQYGNPEIVAGSVLDEIMALDHKKLGTRFMPALSSLLEDSEALLDNLEMTDWLTSALSIRQMEDLLPPEEKIRWAEKMDSYTGATKYEKFKAFLEERKRISEKMRSIGRNRDEPKDDPSATPGKGKGKCEYCKIPGHKFEDCEKKKKYCRDNKLCFKCLESHNFRKNCPGKPPKDPGGPPKRGGGGKDHGVHSNSLRPADCLRCKYIGEQVRVCGGCDMKDKLDHCLAHCENWMIGSVADRSNILKKAGACPVCLFPGHKADVCKNKDNPKYICGVRGCTAHHHVSLHGSKDPIVMSVRAVFGTNIEPIVEDVMKAGGFVDEDTAKELEALKKLIDGQSCYKADKSLSKEDIEERLKEIDKAKKFCEERLLDGDNILMTVQTLSMKYGLAAEKVDITVFWDDGSTCSVIVSEVAEKFGLYGEPLTITINTVTGSKKHETKLYSVELLARDGSVRLLRAIGLPAIGGPMPEIILECGLKLEFSAEAQKAWPDIVQRPIGCIDLLIGSERAAWHPRYKEASGDLVIKECPEFGQEMLLWGSHPSISCVGIHFTEEVKAIRLGSYAKINQIGIKCIQPRNFQEIPDASVFRKMEELCYEETPMEVDEATPAIEKEEVEREEDIREMEVQVNTTVEAKPPPADFWTAEGLGCEPPTRCKACKKCRECSFSGRQVTSKEAWEYGMMEDRIVYNTTSGRFHVQYFFLDDPNKLPDNKNRVLKMAIKEEAKYKREGRTAQGNTVFHKMVDIGTLELLTDEMDRLWGGPRHYVPLQHVLNDASPTTPLRIVSNTSLVDPKTGISLNGMLAKGPAVLNDCWEILLRYRCYDKTLLSDIWKAYYHVMTGELEFHIRRVFWRDGDESAEWKIYGFRTMSMGDRPAACSLEIVIKMTVEMFGHLDPIAGERILKDRFVDDVPTGGTPEEVERFVGVEDESLQCSGTIPQIFRKADLKLKVIALSGEPDGKKLEMLGGTVLGMNLSTERDTIGIKFRANTSKRKRGVPSLPDLTQATLHTVDPTDFNMRICLGITNMQFDAISLATPITIQLKVAMKKLFAAKLSWDEQMSEDLQQEWVKLVELLVEVGDLEFPRAIRPKGATNPPTIISFWDGSDSAFSCAIYIRWLEDDGSPFVRLVASKAKVSPMWSIGTPRMELCGALLMMRNLYRVVNGLDQTPEKVWIAGDSETILACREKEAGFFGEYFGNRLGQIWNIQEKLQEITSIGNEGEWWHVASDDNPADRPTRMGSRLKDVDMDSPWQNGPDYLKEAPEEWPFERNFAKQKKARIPREELVKKYRGLGDEDVNISGLVLEKDDEKFEVSTEMFESVVKTRTESTPQGPASLDNAVLQKFQYGRITNSWEVLIRKTGWLFRWQHIVQSRKTEPGSLTVPVKSERESAVMFWIRAASPATVEAHAAGKLRNLTLVHHDVYPEVLVVKGRAMEGLKTFFHQEFLPVIMGSTRIAFLIILWAHEQDHAGVDITCMTATQVAWIVGHRPLAKRITEKCVRCRFLHKQLEGQKMACLPPRITLPCPVFSHLGLDLAGPFVVTREKGGMATRGNPGTMKVWAGILLCLNTHAVKILIIRGYSTEDFLLMWSGFVADHGEPATVHTDRGSQLLSAAKRMAEADGTEYDWETISRSMAGKTTWFFAPPGGQHRNGAPEAFVKKFKRSMYLLTHDKRLSLIEMEVEMRVVAAVLNSRPIYAKIGPRGGNNPDFLTPITPNMLLLGRCNMELPFKDYDLSNCPLKRLRYVHEIVAAWWNQWKWTHFSSLVPTTRWQLEKRNLQEGDVVLIAYMSKSAPGTYRLGIVEKVVIDDDGLVRTALVSYNLFREVKGMTEKDYAGITRKTIQVAIQRLVLILPIEERDPQDDPPIDVLEEDSKDPDSLSKVPETPLQETKVPEKELEEEEKAAFVRLKIPERIDLVPGGGVSTQYRYEYRILDRDLAEWSMALGEKILSEDDHWIRKWDQREILHLLEED